MSDSGSDHAPLPRSIGWLLNVAYAALLLAVSPLLIYRSITQGKYRSGWNEKLLGRVPELPPVAVGRKRYWFHAVSVGEVLLLRSVLTELQRREPDAELVVSTTTSTGHAVAREKFAFATVCYFPLDFTWAVNTAIERIKPTQFVLVELELWPNILSSIARHGVPLSLINGRLSEHSSRGYAKARWLLRPLLQSFHQIAVQNETYAERFRLLGASSQSVVVTGSVKFDGVETQRNNDRTQMLRASFGLGSDEPVFIAGSTQVPEEEIAIAAWQRARQVEPGLRLVLVPRHKERFADVAEQVTSSGLTLLRRTASSETLSGPSPLWGEGGRRPEEGESSVAADGSVGAAPLPPCGHPLPRGERGFDEPVLLLDTLGELSACWGLADFAFVGGSLTNRGGQNMIEPAAYGAAVCFGPNTRNFRDTVAALLDNDAAQVVTDVDSLAATLIEWLTDRDAAAAMGRRAQEFVLSQQGATERTLDCLCGSEEQATAQRAA